MPDLSAWYDMLIDSGVAAADASKYTAIFGMFLVASLVFFIFKICFGKRR